MIMSSGTRTATKPKAFIMIYVWQTDIHIPQLALIQSYGDIEAYISPDAQTKWDHVI